MAGIVTYTSMELGEGEFGAAFWRTLREGGLRGMMASLLWALYWMRSQRVRLTFGANAFGRHADAPSTLVAPVS
jgi:hypothetical protein